MLFALALFASVEYHEDMKHLVAVLLIFLCPAIYALEGVCIRVADGDTITIKAGNVEEKIRLDGIDAPESSQPSGREAKQYLSGRVLKQTVRVEGSQRDRYGRLLGTVYVGGKNINLEMLRKGWAWDYVQYSKGGEYTLAEREARQAKRGLWAESSPLPPWEYRHPERYGHSKRIAAEKGRPEAATAMYWISNSGKTHNRRCKQFLGNKGTGHYSDTPSGVDAKCCGGAAGR